MEYQVPQFIEVEDKIIGPLTLKQFIYVAGGGGLCVVFFSYLPFVPAVLLSLPVGGLSAALAFYKVNGKPFIEMLEAGFNYYIGAKLFLWKHDEQKAGQAPSAAREKQPGMSARPAAMAPAAGKKLTRGRLAELAWSLDIKAREPSLNLRAGE